MTTPPASGASHSPPDGILGRLRSETRPEHDAIEEVLDLTASNLTMAAYRLRLSRFYGFYVPIEDRLAALGAFAPSATVTVTCLAPRPKAPLLLADLTALGIAAPERLPRCWALPDLTGLAEALGCQYVLEGASLGGQVIARHIHRTLGIGPDSGGRFFQGYGAETGPHWRQFTATLVAFAASREREDATVNAALATFRCLRRWCQEGPLRA